MEWRHSPGLRPDTNRFLEDELRRRGSPNGVNLKKNLDHPGRLLGHFGVDRRADLLQQTVIAMDDVEFLITLPAARALARGDEVIVLRRMDNREFAVGRDRVLMAIKCGGVFDQLPL
jgi:hypothetical protein